MPDLDDSFEPQDQAEAYDETHNVDELALGSNEMENDPDIAEDVYDVITAAGDSDDDEPDGSADDMLAADLDALDLDDEQDADEDNDSLSDGLDDAPEISARDGLDRLIDRTAERGAPIEPGLVYVDDVDAVTYPRDDDVEKYESTRELSDEQLTDLGYLDRSNKEEVSMTDNQTPDTVSVKEAGSSTWEERSFVNDAESALIEGTGAKASDVRKENDPEEEDRLDEGLEETFPASDPVSAKHIT